MTVKEYNRSVEEYADSVFRFILADIKDEERANDIVQDTFEKLWRNVSELDFKVVKSWLFSTEPFSFETPGLLRLGLIL